MNIFRKKDLNSLLSLSRNKSGLRKDLTAYDLILLGIGSTIGVGIFILPGLGALKAGPALVISFIVAGIACILAALCYAEFASLVPVSGSVYTYTYVTMGEVFAWIIGWDLALEYLLGASTVSVGWSGYFESFLHMFGLDLPDILTAAPGSLPGTYTLFNLPAFIIIFLITFLLSLGVREFKRVNNFMVILKIGIVLLFIVMGVWYVNSDNWVPFSPYGFNGVVNAAALVFFAFIGFDAVSGAAEETKNPSRDVPRGIIFSLLICTGLYVLVTLIMTGIVPYLDFARNMSHPISLAVERTGQTWVSYCINLGATLGMMTGILVLLYSQIRLVFSMARDGLLPNFLADVHSKFLTPAKATWITGLIAGLVAGLVPLQSLTSLVNIGTLSAFSLVAVGVLLLRIQQPNLKRPFRCPGFPVLPIVSVLLNLYLMLRLESFTWAFFLLWLAIGLLIYIVYSKHRSKLNN